MKHIISSSLIAFTLSHAASAFAHTQVLPLSATGDSHDAFYCVVNKESVSQVTMQNKNCLISGFNGDGQFQADGVISLTKMNNTYFDVKDDPSATLKLTQSVVITFDGSDPNGVVCYQGKGSRSIINGNFYGYGLHISS